MDPPTQSKQSTSRTRPPTRKRKRAKPFDRGHNSNDKSQQQTSGPVSSSKNKNRSGSWYAPIDVDQANASALPDTPPSEPAGNRAIKEESPEASGESLVSDPILHELGITSKAELTQQLHDLKRKDRNLTKKINGLQDERNFTRKLLRVTEDRIKKISKDTPPASVRTQKEPSNSGQVTDDVGNPQTVAAETTRISEQPVASRPETTENQIPDDVQRSVSNKSDLGDRMAISHIVRSSEAEEGG